MVLSVLASWDSAKSKPKDSWTLTLLRKGRAGATRALVALRLRTRRRAIVAASE